VRTVSKAREHRMVSLAGGMWDTIETQHAGTVRLAIWWGGHIASTKGLWQALRALEGDM